MEARWYYLSVNPEPWAVGSLDLGRKNGKVYPRIGPNIQLKTFQEAVREDIQTIENIQMLPDGEYVITFWFWRRLDRWLTQSERTASSNVADATNMQKATEDALQSILFKNDRLVRDIRSVIVEQDFDVKPGIVIKAEMWKGIAGSEIPKFVWEQRLESDSLTTLDNSWPPKGAF